MTERGPPIQSLLSAGWACWTLVDSLKTKKDGRVNKFDTHESLGGFALMWLDKLQKYT